MLETAILNVQGHTGLDHCQVNVVSVEEADLPAASLDPAGQNTAGQTPTERDRQADPVDEQAFIRGYILTLEGTGRVFTFHAADDRVVLVDVQP